LSLNTPNIDKAKVNIMSETPAKTQLFCRTEPKSFPVDAAKYPSELYIKAMPRTYMTAFVNECFKVSLEPCFGLNKDAVTVNMGYTQGVKFTAKPVKKKPIKFKT
jgi:hypothetical protein